MTAKTASELLKQAAAIVSGDREADYGDKTLNHQRIAGLWAFWLQQTGRPVKISAYDVAIMMVMLKLARLMHSKGNGDTHLDIAGYAAVAHEIHQKCTEVTEGVPHDNS